MCGIAVACSSSLMAPAVTHSMLTILQNRGDQTSGLAISGGCQPHEVIVVKGAGSPEQVIPPHMVPLLRGHACIGHNRYATVAGSNSAGAHPFHFRDLAVCHNGQVNNVDKLKAELMRGTNLAIGSDTEVIAALLGQMNGSLSDRLTAVCNMLKGSYVLTVLQSGGTIAIARDPGGNRPVSEGYIETDASPCYLAASETCAIEMVGGTVTGEIAPGEIRFIYPDRSTDSLRFAPEKPCHCIFELIYFQRPMSEFRGVSCLKFRIALGAELARENGLSADDNAYVVPVLNSGLGGAMGLASESRIEYYPLLINTGLVARTFIMPSQQMRAGGVDLKHFPARTKEGQRYHVVDDSIVRGTTIGPMVSMLRRNNPESIDVWIPCPMFMHRCVYGIDTPTDEELIANRMGGDVGAICNEIGADSLRFLSLEGLNRVIASFGWEPNHFCKACFDGNYPV